MDLVTARLNALQQAMHRINAIYDDYSLNKHAAGNDLREDFAQLFHQDSQKAFVEDAKGSRQLVLDFFCESLNEPQPDAIRAIFDPAANQTEILNSTFCSTFLEMRRAANTFVTPEQLRDGLRKAIKWIPKRKFAHAFHTLMLVDAAQQMTFAKDKHQQKKFLWRMLPHAQTAATRVVSTDPLAPLHGYRWSLQLLDLQLAALGCEQDASQRNAHLSAEDINNGLAHSYRNMLWHMQNSDKQAFQDIALLRAYKLFSVVDLMLVSLHEQKPQHPSVTFWKENLFDQHQELYAHINLEARKRQDPDIHALVKRSFAKKISTSRTLMRPDDNQPFTDAVALLALPWVQKLSSDLKRALAQEALRNGKGGRAVHNRALCLYGEPGNGKTEAIKYVLSHVMKESMGADAEALGWLGPVLAHRVDGDELWGSHYNESAAKIRQCFESIRQEAEDDRGVALVFVDEIDRFLMGGEPTSHKEDDKNLAELLRVLDNSISGNRLFFICATNQFERLAKAAQSRLNVNKVHHKTPPAMRRTAIKALFYDWDAHHAVPMTVLVGLENQQEQQAFGIESSFLVGRAINHVMSALCSPLTMRDICGLQDRARTVKSCTDVAAKQAELARLHAKVAKLAQEREDNTAHPWLTAYQTDDKAHQSAVTAATRLVSMEQMQTLLDECSSHQRPQSIHIKTIIDPHYTLSLFAQTQGLMLMASAKKDMPNKWIEVRHATYRADPDSAIEAIEKNWQQGKPQGVALTLDERAALCQMRHGLFDERPLLLSKSGANDGIYLIFDVRVTSRERHNPPQSLRDLFAHQKVTQA